MFGLILDIKREKSRKLSHIMNECTLGYAMWRKLVLISFYSGLWNTIKALKREVGPNRWWYISIEIGIGIRIEDKGQHNILVQQYNGNCTGQKKFFHSWLLCIHKLDLSSGGLDLSPFGEKKYLILGMQYCSIEWCLTPNIWQTQLWSALSKLNM